MKYCIKNNKTKTPTEQMQSKYENNSDDSIQKIYCELIIYPNQVCIQLSLTGCYVMLTQLSANN